MRACPSRRTNAFARFDNRAIYRDNVQSYTNTEPAIDLTASSLLAFSWQSGRPAALGEGLSAMTGLFSPPVG
jgi:hypothetical protein